MLIWASYKPLVLWVFRDVGGPVYGDRVFQYLLSIKAPLETVFGWPTDLPNALLGLAITSLGFGPTAQRTSGSVPS